MSRRHRDLRSFVETARIDAAAVAAAGLWPFLVDGFQIGSLRPAFAGFLRRWPAIFDVGADTVALQPALATAEARTLALHAVTSTLAREGAIPGWRDEAVSVAARFGDPEWFRLERAATRSFGVVCHAVHLNGFVRRRGAVRLWIARRALDKTIDPGLLDCLVGGRIAAAAGVAETLRREAWEEAGLPLEALAEVSGERPLQIEYLTPEGLHREILFVHDAFLPEALLPVNQDGEVSELTCLEPAEVVAALLDGRFTREAGAATLDGLLRQGLLPGDRSRAPDLLARLRPAGALRRATESSSP